MPNIGHIMGTTASFKRLATEELLKLMKMLESHVPFEKWGFRQSFYGVSEEFVPGIIYDSDKCRVRFGWIPSDLRDGPDSATLNILYGRLHAQNHQRFKIWEGRQCYCWHNLFIDKIYHFLDGLSPQETVNKEYELPGFISQFNELNKDSGWSNIEWSIRQTSLIWEYYGSRLFDLFDLRHPDLWEQYTNFLREFYQLSPEVFHPSAPPGENVC